MAGVNNTKITRLALTVSLLLTLSCVVPTAWAAPAVQQDDPPETPEEYLETFRGLDGTEAFESYSEFEVIRSQAVQDVQVGEFTETTKQRLQTVLTVLNTFEEVINEQQTQNYASALTLADEIRRLAGELREIERGEEYALLTDIALDRFYAESGEALLAAADETDNTPRRIELLSQSARAYDQAGATERFGQVELRADRTEREFAADLEMINQTETDLSGFVGNCEDCGSVDGIILNEYTSTFGLYTDSLSAVSTADQGISLADKHGLTPVKDEISTVRETADNYRQNLAIASATLLFGYSTGVGFIVALITRRIMLWRRDFVASQQGDVVLVGEMLNA